MDYDDLEEALRAHGIPSKPYSDDESDGGKSDFDDVYALHKPDPIPLSELKERIVKIGHNQPKSASTIPDVLEIANKFNVLSVVDNQEVNYESEGKKENSCKPGTDEGWQVSTNRKSRKKKIQSQINTVDVYARAADVFTTSSNSVSKGNSQTTMKNKKNAMVAVGLANEVAVKRKGLLYAVNKVSCMKKNSRFSKTNVFKESPTIIQTVNTLKAARNGLPEVLAIPTTELQSCTPVQQSTYAPERPTPSLTEMEHFNRLLANLRPTPSASQSILYQELRGQPAYLSLPELPPPSRLPVFKSLGAFPQPSTVVPIHCCYSQSFEYHDAEFNRNVSDHYT